MELIYKEISTAGNRRGILRRCWLLDACDRGVDDGWRVDCSGDWIWHEGLRRGRCVRRHRVAERRRERIVVAARGRVWGFPLFEA